MSYFVTGATGFIGRHLVERLLEREGDIHVLVREGSREKLDALIERWGAADRIKPVVGDLTEPLLGRLRRRTAGARGRRPLLPPRRDLRHDRGRDAQRAAQRRRHAERGRPRQRRSARASSTTCPRSPSPAATRATSPRTCSTRARSCPRPTTGRSSRPRSSSASGSRAPGACTGPSIVVGNSKTGEMDKIDGPYYFFKAIQKLAPRAAGVVPAGLARVGLDEHRAGRLRRRRDRPHRPRGRASTARRSTSSTPRASRAGEVMNTFARAGHAPAARSMRDRQEAHGHAPEGRPALRDADPGAQGRPQARARRPRDPRRGPRARRLHRASSTRATPSARCAGSGIELPPLETYADKLWDYWERNLDPDLFKDRSFEGAVNGRTVVITGASSGIGRAAALKIAAAGGIPILVARTRRSSRRCATRSRRAGGTAYVYSADLSDYDSIDALVEKILSDHAAVDMLVNNAGRSIRRSVMLSYDRFHDYERTIKLNYLGTIKLILGLLPHMTRARLRPRRQRLLDRRADQPAALLRLRRLQGGAGRLHARGVARRRSATASRSRRSTCRSCARR